MMLTHFAVILVTLVLMSIYILGVLRQSLATGENSMLFAKANIIADTVKPCYISPDSPDPAREARHILSGTGIRAIAVNPAYTVVYDSSADASLVGKVLMRDIITTALSGEQASGISRSDGRTVMSVAVPVISDKLEIGAVYLSETVDDIDKTVSYVEMNMLIFSVLISILVGMLSMGVSLAVTSPIDEFIKAAKEISKGNYKLRLPLRGTRELAQMAEAMNGMCEELENIDETHSKFISDVSHELKTPLASIKLICDSIVDTKDPDIGMIKEFLGDLSNEVDRLSRIVERLLTLTKISADEETPALTPVDFNVMLNAIINRLAPNAGAKHIMLFGDFSQNAVPPVLIDYDRIWEAIYNITDNAVKYTPENGSVKVGLSTDGLELCVTVDDSGGGIPEEARDKIFERFYRLDDSRARETGGTGLGLAIAKEAVAAHGGHITVGTSEWGGARFSIYLPCRTAENA